MSSSRSGERVNASVAGISSSDSYISIAAPTSASFRCSWLMVRPMTRASEKVWIRLISLAGEGMSIRSKSQRATRPGKDRRKL